GGRLGDIGQVGAERALDGAAEGAVAGAEERLRVGGERGQQVEVAVVVQVGGVEGIDEVARRGRPKTARSPGGEVPSPWLRKTAQFHCRRSASGDKKSLKKTTARSVRPSPSKSPATRRPVPERSLGMANDVGGAKVPSPRPYWTTTLPPVR